MDTNTIIKALSMYLIVSGLFVLLRGKTLPLVLKDLMNHRAVMWLAGFLLIMVGGSLVFGSDEPLVITVLGWLIVVKGALYILAPEFFTQFVFTLTRPLLVLLSIVIILFGLLMYEMS